MLQSEFERPAALAGAFLPFGELVPATGRSFENQVQDLELFLKFAPFLLGKRGLGLYQSP